MPRRQCRGGGDIIACRGGAVTSSASRGRGAVTHPRTPRRCCDISARRAAWMWRADATAPPSPAEGSIAFLPTHHSRFAGPSLLAGDVSSSSSLSSSRARETALTALNKAAENHAGEALLLVRIARIHDEVCEDFMYYNVM